MADNTGDSSEGGSSMVLSGDPHWLEKEWVFWEHRLPDKNSKSYEENMTKLCEVATIEELNR